jgi:NAD(P)-dependent dehydrogenase (short-subunit alcohol dehydrogenase family)
MADLDDRIIVITGGARGIGAATAAVLVERGAHVVIGDLLEDVGTTTARELDGTGRGRAEFRRLDVTDPEGVARFAAEVLAAHGKVDGLMNNAGIVEDQSTFELDLEVWSRTLAVNLTGSFLCARELGRSMTTGGGGAIVNVSSIAGISATHPETHLAYDVTKAGVAQMTRSLAVEWARHAIRVNAVAPGYTHTQILDEVGSTDPQTMSDWLGQIPTGRLIEPSEIAHVVAFLLSDDAGAINGHVLTADAGYSIY